jgi:hypothetical protein
VKGSEQSGIPHLRKKIFEPLFLISEQRSSSAAIALHHFTKGELLVTIGFLQAEEATQRTTLGETGPCPVCGNDSFVISRQDDRVGQCYSPACGIRTAIREPGDLISDIYFRLYAAFHAALLKSTTVAHDWLAQRGFIAT